MTDTAQWLLNAAIAAGIILWLIYTLLTNSKKQTTMCNKQSYQDKIQSYQDKINGIINGTIEVEGVSPEKAAIIAQALAKYEPIVPPAACGDNATSYEIAELLSDITTLQTTEVGSVMIRLGYHLHLNAYKGYEWSMRNTTTTDNEDELL